MEQEIAKAAFSIADQFNGDLRSDLLMERVPGRSLITILLEDATSYAVVRGVSAHMDGQALFWYHRRMISSCSLCRATGSYVDGREAS
jgi:hypothetical protein